MLNNKFLYLLLATCYFSLLVGCATVYTIEPGGKKYNNGYVVKRNTIIIPEFTVDSQNQAPLDSKIATRRFKRRKKKILSFYQQMGYFGSTVLEDAKMFGSSFWAPFRAPIEGVKYHKYETDPVYRAKIDAQDEQEEKREQEMILSIQKRMQDYIVKDMELEKK
ncbi:MAG: hypothetical protein AB1629_03170 [Candidatus Omnitrophota bacterium]